MTKDAKKVKDVKDDSRRIRVLIPKSTHKALKVKCALMDITVKHAIVDMVEKWVKDVKADIEGTKTIRPKA